MDDTLSAAIRSILPEITALRHELHQHPEIRFEERWTSARIEQFLANCGIPSTGGLARGTGLVATIQGAGPKTIALRADLDALEIQEETGLPYASTIPGRMHACGHDGHIACLCGAAKLLAARKHSLKGAVKLIFQPAEELGAAGRTVVEEGALDGVDAVFALHAWPALPASSVGVKNGPLMAGADWFAIDIHGRGAHGAEPSSSIDPIVVMAHTIIALQTIVSREIDPCDPAVVTIGRAQAGVTRNIIPETARIEGTIRTLSPAVREAATAAVERIAHATAAAFRATATVTFGDEWYIPLINDPAMADFARDTIRDALGPQALVEIERPSMTSEDFAYYLERIPGAFLWLGVGPAASLHTSHFNFNDDALATGIALLTSLALRFLA